MPSPGYFLADAQITTAQVTTTDATQTVLWSFPIPTHCVGRVRAVIVGRKSDTSAVAIYERVQGFKRATSAGAVTGAAGGYAPVPDYEDDSNWDATVDVSSSTFRVLVTGVAATTIQWTARIEIVNG